MFDYRLNNIISFSNFNKLIKIRSYRSAIAPGMVLTFVIGKLVFIDIVEFASEMEMEVLTIKPIKIGDYYNTIEVHLLCDNP